MASPPRIGSERYSSDMAAPRDTSPEAYAVLIDALRAAGPEARVAMAADMSDARVTELEHGATELLNVERLTHVLSADWLEQHGVLPLRVTDGVLKVGTWRPSIDPLATRCFALSSPNHGSGSAANDGSPSSSCRNFPDMRARNRSESVTPRPSSSS